jgi:outer membrane receptor for ferrienterochelin and colicins
MNIKNIALIGLTISTPLWASPKASTAKLSFESLINVKVSVASLKAENVSDAPGIISVYTNQDIKRWNWQSLEEVLMQTPGFYSRQSLALGTHGTMGARGDQPYFGNRLLFLVDGRPFRSSLYGASYADLLYNFPMQAVERIEIIRGPGSVLYGSSAYDGVVSVVTRKADKEGLQGANWSSRLKQLFF